MRPTRPVLFLLFLAALAAPRAARAQGAPPEEAGRIQFGPLSLNPRFELKDVGVDSNVFNSADNPQSDFTATMSPILQARLRMRSLEVTYNSRLDLVYFQKFKDEQSANRSSDVRVEFPLNRLRPYATFGGINTRERMNGELDARASRAQTQLGAGLDVLLSAKTTVAASVRRADLDFDDAEVFDGVPLSRTLNSRIEAGDLGLRFALTPLTSFGVSVGIERDRFPLSPSRDSESFRITPALTFAPTALLSGTVALGYRRFEPKDPLLEGFTGIVVNVDVSATVRGTTRIDARVERDIRYSFEPDQPYYLSSGGRLIVTQRVGGPFDVQGVIGRHRLRYQDFEAAAAADRIDTLEVVGGGVGFRLGQTARIGINAEFSRRVSDTRPDRDYEKRRYYAALTYGF